jgi:polyisoprenoid-binding protein YceI
MSRLIFAILAALLCTAPAQAAQWKIDHAKSRLAFTVRWSSEPFVATFKSWDAAIDFDPADLAHSHVLVSIDLGSESSDTPDNDDGLKGPEGFAVSQFPKAQFESTDFVSKGGGNYVMTGKLSLHGVTHPVNLPFTLRIAGNNAHAVGAITVLRTDYGLGRGEWAGTDPIAHEVVIDLDIVATKAP